MNEATPLAYGTQTYSTEPCWTLICDNQYYYTEPEYLIKGHREVGYYSRFFQSEAEAMQYITDNNLIFFEPIEVEIEGETVVISTPPYREEDGTLLWFAGEWVSLGMLRTHNDITYKCLQAHATQSDWPPDITPALWEVIPDSTQWTAGVYYPKGYICQYSGTSYRCIQTHTSQSDWQPPNVPALWEVYIEPTAPDIINEWQQPSGSSDAYRKGVFVTYQGQTWLNDFDYNPYAPGVYGWILVSEPGNLCETSPAWFSQVWPVGSYVKDNNKIWKAKANNAFTWVKPALTGDGAISWEFIKDCIEPPVEPPANPCDSIAIWNPNEDYNQMKLGDLRKREVSGVWKVYAVKDLGFVHYDPSGPNGHYGWTYQYDCQA